MGHEAQAPVQPWEMQPDSLYVAASHFGATYNGPVGNLGFVDGVATHLLGNPQDRFSGRELQGALTLVYVWPYREEYVLRWWGDAWEYVPEEVAASPVTVEVKHPKGSPAKKKPKPKPKRRRSTKRKPMAKAEG